MTPTARSLAHARKLGFLVDVVERRLPRCFITKDLFGAFDLVAIGAGQVGVLGIQTTSGSNASARLKKLAANPTLRTWLEAGNAAELWSWRKGGPRGKRKTWQVTRRPIVLADLVT